MFRKLKDKITEEVKQSPLKSVQQLATAVVSPSSSSVFEPSSNDHFCIDDGDDDQEPVQNSPAKTPSGFTTVNLLGQASPLLPPLVPEPLHSRRSSVSSVTSDVSSLFPRYEPSSVHFHLQSDLESASEFEDSSLNSQLERISKENLFEAYRKLKLRYNKYKGRFVDLADHYRRLEKENIKCKSILSETQDKAFRRISELREQCTLEQEAKAHLEEALRSDLEEKDHLIATLNTKIELLKGGNENVNFHEAALKDSENTPGYDDRTTDQMIKKNSTTTNSSTEKEEKYESLLLKCKASILEKNELIEKKQKEFDSLKTLNTEKLESLNGELAASRKEIELLKSTIDMLKRNEEEAALSLAENKLSVHQELETRDEQIKSLKIKIEGISKEKENVENKLKQLESELKTVNESVKPPSEEEKADFIQELARGKSEAVKLMQQKLLSVEQTLTEKLSTKELELEKIVKENNALKENVKSFENKLSMVEARLTGAGADSSNTGCGDTGGDKIKNCMNSICQREMEEITTSKRLLETQILEKDNDIKSLTNTHNLVLQEKDSVITEMSSEIVGLIQKISELQLLKENIQSEINAREDLQKKLEEVTGDKNKLNSELVYWKELSSAKNTEINEVNIAIQKTVDELNASKTKLQSCEEVLVNKETTIRSQEDSINQKNSEINTLGTLNNKLKLKLKEIERNDNAVNNESKKLADNIELLKKEIIYKNEEVSLLKKSFQEEKEQLVYTSEALKQENIKFKNEVLNKDELLSTKKEEIHRYKEKLESFNKNMETFKSEANESSSILKEEYEECKAKNKTLHNFLTFVKSIIVKASEGDFTIDTSLPMDSNNELQSDSQIIISAINSLIQSIKKNRNVIEELKSDLKVTRESVDATHSEQLSLKSALENECFKKQKLLSDLMCQVNSIREIKSQQNELNSLIKQYVVEFKNDFNSICLDETFKSICSALEKGNDDVVRETTSELNRCKTLISQMQHELKDKEEKLHEFSELKIKFEEEKNELSTKVSLLQNEIYSMQVTCDQLNEKLDLKMNQCKEMEVQLQESSTKLDNELGKFDQLKSEFLVTERDYKLLIEAKDRELSSLIDELVIKDNDHEEELGKRDKEIENLTLKLKTAEDTQNRLLQSKDSDIILIKDALTAKENSFLGELDSKNKQIKEFETALVTKEKEIKDLKDSINTINNEKGSVQNESALLEGEITNLKEELTNLMKTLQEKTDIISNLESKYDAIKKELQALSFKHKEELNALNNHHMDIVSNEIIKVQNDSLSQIEALKMTLSGAESNNIKLQESLNESKLTSEKLIRECNELKLSKEKLTERINHLTEELNRILPNQSSFSKFSEKDWKLVKKENEELKFKLNNLEEKQAEKIKELIFDFNLQLSQKDEEMKSIELHNFERRQDEEDFVIMELKQQIKDLQHELELRGDAFEKLVEDHKEEKKNTEKTELDLKNNYDIQLRENDKKWRACLDRRLAETEAKFKEEIDELSKEWKSDRKFESESANEALNDKNKELECSSQLAVAAMESSVNSVELLRKQVTIITQQLEEEKRQHKREVSELQRLLVIKKLSKKSKNDNLSVEDCTEMEYLRNILFEYMMGKEPLVLAKVLSAIVKFDADQTNKVLQKEEQKISLLGQLGIS